MPGTDGKRRLAHQHLYDAGTKTVFAGTYFPKTASLRHCGLGRIVCAISEKWRPSGRRRLKSSGGYRFVFEPAGGRTGRTDKNLLDLPANCTRTAFDETYGGFGKRPNSPLRTTWLFLPHLLPKNRSGVSPPHGVRRH